MLSHIIGHWSNHVHVFQLLAKIIPEVTVYIGWSLHHVQLIIFINSTAAGSITGCELCTRY